MEIEKFKNTLIAFDTSNEMVNATDMIRAFPGKRMNDFLRLKGTKEFVSLLESKTGIPVTVVKQGGSEQGTWMNKVLAYDFAAWLDPEFRLFVYQVFDNAIRERIKTQQSQLDYFWDKSDQQDLYPKRKS